jgi:hypothetical protein
MRKIAIAAAAITVTAAVAGTVVLAQSGPPMGPGMMGPGMMGPGMMGPGHGRMAAISPETFQSLVDARIAALQAGLKLTDAQKALWPPVESAIRSAAQKRFAAMQEMREQRRENRGDFMERLERGTRFSEERTAVMKDLTAAIKPLWASLDERQKALVPMLIGPAGFTGHGKGMMHRGEERRGGTEGFGFQRFGENGWRGEMAPPWMNRPLDNPFGFDDAEPDLPAGSPQRT